ncbi:MAG: response regulator [Rubrivivax sp.]|nr:response regulator [Rubrivivax sp.]
MSAPPALLALLGFNAFERRSFAAFFALGREHGPGYELTGDLLNADCAVADADDPQAMALLVDAGLLPRSVLLGQAVHHGAALQLPRPINLLLVMRALDTVVGARPRTTARLATAVDEAPAQPPASAAASPRPPAPALPRPTPAPLARPSRGEDQVQRVLDELAFRTATLPAHIDARAMAAEAACAARRGTSAALERPDIDRRHSRTTRLPMEHILVVDNDAATLRMVATQLQRFGFQIHLAGQADDAMRLLTTRFHDYVFVDPALPGLDALLVCRLAKQVPSPAADRPATTVVLLADPNALAALLERALPAADACLRKPLEQTALLRLMGEREVARVAYADTARSSTLI